ncbi:hypothetical protein GCM10020367_70510 [Streptomyces sannanensis]|uniref:Uncharacterized protein n=1 Tax=Streptomyces sannanensis TaxID=285536 RepID=A0ABP6SMW1_9ACTN
MQQRQHADLTPHFRCTVVANEARSTAMLRVTSKARPELLSTVHPRSPRPLRNDNRAPRDGPNARAAARPPKTSAPYLGAV